MSGGRLADLVVLVHLVWILFLILGAIPGSRLAWVKWLHLAALAFSLLLQLCGWLCPLTLLEVWLRRRESPDMAYEGTFIGAYASKIVYLELSPRIVFLGTVLVVIASLYTYLRRRPRPPA